MSATPPSSAQPAAAAPTAVQTLLNAANRGDTEAFLAGFAPDGVVDDWGHEYSGPDAIRSWSDAEFIGVAVSLTVLEAATDGAVTTVRAQVGGRGFKGPSHFAFTTAGRAITRMQIRA